MLHLNLPNDPTIGDAIVALQKCDPTKRITDDVYRPITAIVLDVEGDAMVSILPRMNTRPRETIRCQVSPELLKEATRTAENS
jgi:hypothetical protein